MYENKHTLIATILVLCFGFSLFFFGTDGFRAFTAESARTYELMDTKPVFPSVTLQDSQERVYSFEEFAQDKYVFVTFMYTNCTTVCPKLEMNMAEVYKEVPTESIGEDIVFLSISFDTKNDDPKTLAKYRTYFGSDGETWRMARVPEQQELEKLLNTLGVIVIPDGYGNFQHNTAFYLIDPSNKLVEVMDFTEIESAINKVNSYIQEEEEE